MGNSHKKGWSHFKLNINDPKIQFPQILRIQQRIGKIFFIGEYGINPLGILHILHNIWPKGPKDIYFQPMYISLQRINSRDSSVNIVPLFVFTIIFRFLRTLLITLMLDERYMCCSMKIQNNCQHKHILQLYII